MDSVSENTLQLLRKAFKLGYRIAESDCQVPVREWAGNSKLDSESSEHVDSLIRNESNPSVFKLLKVK